MYKSKFLLVLVVFVYVLFVFFEFHGDLNYAFCCESLIVPLIGLRYFIYLRPKNVFFLLFFVFYCLSDLVSVVDQLIYLDENSIYYEYAYYSGNILYVLAYMMLFIHIYKSISFKYVFKKLKIHFLVLLVLDVYLIFVLHAIERPGTDGLIDYCLENIYNFVILVVLSLALLNYFYRDNEKSLFLFFGVLCLVFSEVIDVANIHISQSSLLNFLATTLVLGAFYFFYEQAKLPNDSHRDDGKDLSYF